MTIVGDIALIAPAPVRKTGSACRAGEEGARSHITVTKTANTATIAVTAPDRMSVQALGLYRVLRRPVEEFCVAQNRIPLMVGAHPFEWDTLTQSTPRTLNNCN